MLWQQILCWLLIINSLPVAASDWIYTKLNSVWISHTLMRIAKATICVLIVKMSVHSNNLYSINSICCWLPGFYFESLFKKKKKLIKDSSACKYFWGYRNSEINFFLYKLLLPLIGFLPCQIYSNFYYFMPWQSGSLKLQTSQS